MKHIGMLVKLWHDQAGALLSSEYILLGCIVTIGLIVGVSAARIALVEELDDYAHSIDGLSIGAFAGTNEVNFAGGESAEILP